MTHLEGDLMFKLSVKQEFESAPRSGEILQLVNDTFIKDIHKELASGEYVVEFTPDPTDPGNGAARNPVEIAA